MDTNRILIDAGYGNYGDFPQIAQRAVELVRAGCTDKDSLIAKIEDEFGCQIKQKMRDIKVPFPVFGAPGIDIDWKAVQQMDTAMRLPVANAGAMMPDAHVGYALPIGGVIALHQAVSPSFVGYDIACRVTVTILDCTDDYFRANREHYLNIMQAVSRFGVGANYSSNERQEHSMMYDPLWDQLPHLKRHKDLAWSQLGTSGAGNHFFDALVGEVLIDNVEWLPIEFGRGTRFAAIMTHSGSRGVGHKMAGHYMEIAEQETSRIATGVPKGYGWLHRDSEAGQEYLAVMNLMGRYAQANHHIIHDRFQKEAGLQQIIRIENHHNFAWVMNNGDIIHRKGATPAGYGEIGIIPGSCGTKSYIVHGLGNRDSLQSSSHGAGRLFSRTVAKQQYNAEEFENQMSDILHVGVAKDETTAAYKDIDEVMALQKELVTPVAQMFPIAVVMGGK